MVTPVGNGSVAPVFNPHRRGSAVSTSSEFSMVDAPPEGSQFPGAEPPKDSYASTRRSPPESIPRAHPGDDPYNPFKRPLLRPEDRAFQDKLDALRHEHADFEEHSPRAGANSVKARILASMEKRPGTWLIGLLAAAAAGGYGFHGLINSNSKEDK